MRLTDLSIKALKAPDKGAIVYPDDTLTGFGVRVSQAGTKSFVLTHGVRRQRETIGRFGIITLAEARTEAKRLLAEYAPKGIMRGMIAVPFRDEDGNLLGYIGMEDAKLPLDFMKNVVPLRKRA